MEEQSVDKKTNQIKISPFIIQVLFSSDFHYSMENEWDCQNQHPVWHQHLVVKLLEIHTNVISFSELTWSQLVTGFNWLLGEKNPFYLYQISLRDRESECSSAWCWTLFPQRTSRWPPIDVSGAVCKENRFYRRKENTFRVTWAALKHHISWLSVLILTFNKYYFHLTDAMVDDWSFMMLTFKQD